METADLATTPDDQPQAEAAEAPEAPPAAPFAGPPRWDEAAGPLPLAVGPGAEPTVVDWSGRGSPALLVVERGGPAGTVVSLFHPIEGGAEALVFDAGTELPELAGLRLIVALENGGPSRFDLVALDEAAGGLVWLPNQGSSELPRFGERQPLGLAADLGLGVGRIAQLAAVDWDGDGRVDLLVGYDELEGYWPDGDAVPTAQQVGFNPSGGHPGYDRAGQWRGRPPRGRIAWLKNVGGDEGPRFELQPPIAAESGPLEIAARPSPLALAWGRGRAIELMLSDERGGVRLFRNFGGQRPPVLLEPRALRTAEGSLVLPEDRTVLTAADLDGDRSTELVFGTADGRIFAVHAGPGRDEAKAPRPVLTNARALRLGGGAVVAAGDLDGDGGVDLVVGDAAGRLAWVRDLGGPGDHRYGAPTAIDAGGLPLRIDAGPDGRLYGPAGPRLGYASPALVDWSGNGRLDLIVGGAGGDLIHLKNNGSVTDPRYDLPRPLRIAGHALIVPPRVRPAAADWTGSGQIDLIGIDLQGFLAVYPRVGPGEVDAPTHLTDRFGRLIRLDGAFGQAGRCALWCGPWTGPGKLDILVGLPRGARHVVPAICGEPLGATVDDLPTVVLLERVGPFALLPRPLRRADGRPLAVGTEGCSPCGVDWSGRGAPVLLVGSDDGRVEVVPREELAW